MIPLKRKVAIKVDCQKIDDDNVLYVENRPHLYVGIFEMGSGPVHINELLATLDWGPYPAFEFDFESDIYTNGKKQINSIGSFPNDNYFAFLVLQ